MVSPASRLIPICFLLLLLSSAAAPAQEAASGTVAGTGNPLIEHIIFNGNTRTQVWVLRRWLPFEEGEAVDRQKIERGRQHLVNLEYFTSVTWTLSPGSAPGLVDVVFTLKETNTADINFGVIFSGGDFPIAGMIKWNESNLRGRGQTAGADVTASPGKQVVGLHYSDPWMYGIPWSGGLSLTVDHELVVNVPQDVLPPVFTDGQEAIAVPDPYTTYADYMAALAAGEAIPQQYLMSYDSITYTFGANAGYTLMLPYADLVFHGGYTPQLSYLHYDASIYRPFEATLRKTWGFTDPISLGASLDARDIYLYPTKGYYIAQDFTFVGGILFGDQAYIRSDSTIEGFLTVLDIARSEKSSFQVVLAGHSTVSLILPNFAPTPASGVWDWRIAMAVTDQPSIDGLTVGRGWPLMYGGALWDNKLELRVPVIENACLMVGFVEAAGLWDRPWGAMPPATNMSQMGIEDLDFSMGVGLRSTLRVFPICLYLAIPFKVFDYGGVPSPAWGHWGLVITILQGAGTF